MNNYTKARACVWEWKNSYYKVLTNKRNVGKAWQTNKRQHEPTAKLQCCSFKSHKTFDPNRVFWAEVQHSLLPKPPKRNIYIWPQSQQSTLCTCASIGTLVSLGKMKFGTISMFIFHVILDPWWLLPAADWQGGLWKTCFTTKVWILAF